jgi:hypothetical protein
MLWWLQDVDGNGSLDRDEVAPLAEWALENMLESTQAIQMTPEQKETETNKLMAAADTNGDGVVDFDEFKEWFIPTARTIQAQKHKIEQVKKQRRAQKAGKGAMKKPPHVSSNAAVAEECEQLVPQTT